MPKNQESLNSELFALLQSRGYDPVLLDSSGKESPVPEEAEVFQFSFIKDDVDYGKVTVTIDGLRQLVVYYGEKVEKSPKSGSDDSESWHNLLKRLSIFAHNHQLSFDTRYIDRLKYDMAKRAHSKKLDEGYYPMGKKASYSDNIPECKIIIQHSRAIEEGEQRYRNVAKIFIENAQGERFLAPTTKPGIARVYARHIAEGGTPYDERGQHITRVCEEYSKMAGFVRATRGKQFNESATRLVNEGINHYQGLRETLHKMAGKKGYNNYFESWTPPLMEDEEQVDLSEMFMASTLDPRIESVMPILGKLSKNVSEDSMKEVDALEEWASSVVENQLSEDDIEELDEDWKSALAGGALAATMAMGGGAAHAQSVDTQAPTTMTQQAPIGSRYTPGVDVTGPRAFTYQGKEFNFAGRDANAPANAKTTVLVPASVIGIRSLKAVAVQLGADGMYYISAQQPTNEGKGDYVDPEEADYDDEYQDMVKRVGQKAKEQDAAKKAKQPEKTDESLDAEQKSAGQLGPTEKVKNNNIGKLVGESSDIERILKLSGL